MNEAAKKLARHVIAMQNDDYLIGHPEWAWIVKDALDVFGGFKRCTHLYPVDGEDNTFCPRCSAGNVGIPDFELGSREAHISAEMMAAESRATQEVLDKCPHIDTEAECDCGDTGVIIGHQGDVEDCLDCGVECKRCRDSGYIKRDGGAEETCPDCAIAAECSLISYYVGMCKWDGEDMIFVTRNRDITPPEVHIGYSGVKITHPWHIRAYSATDAGEIFLGRAFGLRVGEISHLMQAKILEFGSDGWGLFTWVSNPPDFEGWRLIDHYDRVAQLETNMADQAYYNDLRFGADSDDPTWYGEDHEDPKWHAHPDDYEDC